MILGGLLSADGDVFFCRRTTVERRQWCRLCTRRSCTLPGWATRRQPSSLMATLTSWLSRVTRQKMRYVFYEVNEVFRTSLGSFTKLIQACWWDRTRQVCCSMDYSCRWNDSACTMKEGRWLLIRAAGASAPSWRSPELSVRITSNHSFQSTR